LRYCWSWVRCCWYMCYCWFGSCALVAAVVGQRVGEGVGAVDVVIIYYLFHITSHNYIPYQIILYYIISYLPYYILFISYIILYCEGVAVGKAVAGDGVTLNVVAPLHLTRRPTRLVSYYAFFKGWLLLSQPPSCLCLPTSFPT